MSARRERPRLCPVDEKPIRDGLHQDGSPCLVTCPRCGAQVAYVAGLDSFEHPTLETWSACETFPGGRGSRRARLS